MQWLRRLLVVGLLVGVWYFGWQFAAKNQMPVNVHYVAGELLGIALWKVLLVAFSSGAGLVALYHMFTSARNGLTSRRYRKTIGGLEAEVHQLRNLPLAPESDEKPAAAPDPGAAAAPGVGARD
jgi:hypothetical protein